MSARRWALTLGAALAVAACDGGPEGPGTLTGSVEAPVPLGAVVLEVTGGGVEGFVGAGDTRAYGALVSSAEKRYRVVLVDEAGGQLDFGVRVQDVGASKPSVSVIFAAGADNLPAGTQGISVRLEK